MAETNRTPFDFSEGESELVSGFNVEYRAGGFALIFIAEYASILFLSLLTIVFLGRGGLNGGVGAVWGVVRVAAFWVWLRATLPRLRYDKLIRMAWTRLLPRALFILLLYASLAY